MENELTTVDSQNGFLLPDEASFKNDLEQISRFQKLVKSTFVKDIDYGAPFPGSDKDSLLKPGAEKITKLLGLCDIYEFVDRVEKWDPVSPFFRYLIKCQLKTPRGLVVVEGLGECNSMESKYRWREQQRKCPVCQRETIFKSKTGGWFCWAKKGGCGVQFDEDNPAIINQQIGRIPNDDIYSQVNTLVKIAKKRALVDAALSAGRLSNLFTQDGDSLSHNEGETTSTTTTSSRQNSNYRDGDSQQRTIKKNKADSGPVASGTKGPAEKDWDSITDKDIPDYASLEKVYCRLNPGKSTRDMYIELGGGDRNNMTNTPAQSFLILKSNWVIANSEYSK